MNNMRLHQVVEWTDIRSIEAHVISLANARNVKSAQTEKN